MSQYCQKCGTENEDSSKFCKSCGISLNNEPTRPVIVDDKKNILKTLVKVAVGIIIIFVAFVGITAFIDNIQIKREQQRINDLKNQCNNNSAKACYEYSIELKYYSGERTTKARNEALAKGCQLGSKDACREGEYYKHGCELQDGESCYRYAGILANKGTGSIMCDVQPDSNECHKYKESYRVNIQPYINLACKYGYSQGCIQE